MSLPGGCVFTSLWPPLEYKLHEGSPFVCFPLIPSAQNSAGLTTSTWYVWWWRNEWTLVNVRIKSHQLWPYLWYVTCMWVSFFPWLLSLAFYFVLVKLTSLGCLLAILSLDVLGKVWKTHREERFKGWTVLSLKDKELINGHFFLADSTSCLILSYSPSIYFSP